MGFEVLYHYHERLEEGGYDKDEAKTFKKKVGDPYDEVPLERLAGAVMAQLSRRDVWITDVEVFEYSKKRITFRETKGGIVLKNKKFLVDQDAILVVQDIVEVPAQAPAESVARGFHPHNGTQLRPTKWVTFSPELPMLAEVKQKGLRFTVDKRYPVFKEDVAPLGSVYLTVDDAGREQRISDKYFIPAEVNLVLDKEVGFSENVAKREGGKLRWDGMVEDPNMPKLR
jgi:hypothetical protein